MDTRSNSGWFKPAQNVEQIKGRKFGRLLVLEYAGTNKHRSSMWRCICDCGTEGIFKGRNLKIGKTKSCGCWDKEVHAAGVARKHGHTSRTGATPEYNAWKAMHQRCTNPNNPMWKNYGGRGITVCDSWKNFENFIADMGKKPSPNLSLERVANNSGYCKSNCIWASTAMQNRNKRNNVILEYNGKTQTLKDWATEFGLNFNTLYFRILRRWPVEKALLHPLQTQRRRKQHA